MSKHAKLLALHAVHVPQVLANLAKLPSQQNPEVFQNTSIRTLAEPFQKVLVVLGQVGLEAKYATRGSWPYY